jgi:hypothetical protein
MACLPKFVQTALQNRAVWRVGIQQAGNFLQADSSLPESADTRQSVAVRLRVQPVVSLAAPGWTQQAYAVVIQQG